MVYAVRDFYEARIPVPAGQPARESALRLHRRRLFDSFDIPVGREVLQVDEHPRATRPSGAHPPWHRLAHDQREWPQIRDDIDAGQPVPLGLVTVRSINQWTSAAATRSATPTTSSGHPHDPGVRPQHDPAAADDCSLSLDLSHPSETASITHSVSIPDPIELLPYQVRGCGPSKSFAVASYR